MRNVTISLEDDVADWARVWAAKHQTSVSRMLGELLQARKSEEDQYAEAMARYMAVKPVILKAEGKYPSREESHERR